MMAQENAVLKSTDATHISIYGDDDRSFELIVTAELLDLFDHAALINRGTSEKFNYSFSALLLAFVFGGSGVSEWFRGYISEAGADLASILKYRNLEGKEEKLRSLAARQSTPMDLYPDGRRTGTRLALDWTEQAHKFAQEQGHAWVGLRHMMGAIIFTPRFHAEELERWRFDRPGWASAYLGFLAQNLPEDLEFWKQVDARTFRRVEKENAFQSQVQPAAQEQRQQTSQSQPDQPSPLPPEEAASAHIATDSWTVDDKLGHFAYARAIYRFITHEKTEAPLAISIQAPWGGGKTSLMRMVQKQLDPQAVEKIEQERKERRHPNKSTPEEVKPEELREEMGAKAIRLIDVITEIAAWKKSGTDRRVKNPSVPPAGLDAASDPTSAPDQKRRVTVWFNAWKYESTEQVWAGMADCILRQVSARMQVLERQRFWLQLQLSRLDIEKIERRILERIAAEWWRVARPWAWGTVALILALLTAVLARNQWLLQHGAPVTLLSFGVGSFKLLHLYAKTKTEVGNEPAELSLGEYLQVPDYRGKAGFIHEVAEDLNRIMKAIPPGELPIVVFIDDLDRSSPEKVARVTEGINLFLAGEFPDCIFVFGMDAEMVAAALEKAHGDVIGKLPNYAAHIPVGWRFMDKFVQLPFVIPPPEQDDVKRYVESLFEDEAEKKLLPKEVQAQIEDVARDLKVAVGSVAPPKVEDFLKGHDLNPRQQRELASRLEQALKVAEIDAEIEGALRDDEVVRNFVLDCAPDFFRNPRDLKRFLNSFRLYDFLRIARERRRLPAPSRRLIAKWITLSLKWPQVVRWMHRVPGDGAGASVKRDKTTSSSFRLRQLEVLAAEASNRQGFEQWTQLLTAALGADSKDLNWISDPALFEFFSDMGRATESDRLSEGAGKGLW